MLAWPGGLLRGQLAAARRLLGWEPTAQACGAGGSSGGSEGGSKSLGVSAANGGSPVGLEHGIAAPLCGEPCWGAVLYGWAGARGSPVVAPGRRKPVWLTGIPPFWHTSAARGKEGAVPFRPCRAGSASRGPSQPELRRAPVPQQEAMCCSSPACSPLLPLPFSRGRSPEWYNKVFGHLCAMELARIRDSFPSLSPFGPETKI